jgi:hypothetical protein
MKLLGGPDYHEQNVPSNLLLKSPIWTNLNIKHSEEATLIILR